MNVFRAINDAIVFVCEIAMVISFGYWGYRLTGQPILRVGLAILLPVTVMVFWGLVMAPKASYRIDPFWVPVVALILFELAALALWSAGARRVAVLFAIVAVVNQTIAFVWNRG